MTVPVPPNHKAVAMGGNQTEEADWRDRAFRDLADSSPDGFAILEEGRYIYASPAWAKALGVRPEALLGTELVADVFPEDRQTISGWVEGDGDPVVSEYRFAARKGRTAFIQLTRVRLEGAGDRMRVGLIGRDTTGLKQTQAQLLLADRMLSIGALAAGTAHEINNPLTYVQGNLSFVVEELRSLEGPMSADQVAELLEALEEAEEGAERVRVIVRRLHAFARADQDETRVIDANRVVEDAVNMAFTEYRHRARLTRELADGCTIRANGARLGQVLLNLLLNAAHALPEGEAEKNEIRVATAVKDGTVRIAVKDSGPGIPAEIRGRVFDPFFTTKPMGIGTGLGLSIAHSIVAELGGTIRVDSELGRGTEFQVHLPHVDLKAESNDDWTCPAEPGVRGRILVVDDEPLIAMALKRGLREHTVDVAASGKAAVELLSQRNFDLVFCDLMMPEMTGMDVYAWAEKQRPGLENTFVFMTGGIFTPRAKAFLASLQGKNRSMEKPFDLQKLRAFVYAYLEAKQQAKIAPSTGDI